MQDFRNFNNRDVTRLPRDPAVPPTPKKHGDICDKQKAPKKGFVEARINKDNFWNLIFATGMTFGWSLTFFLGQINATVAFISSWATILLVPFTIRILNKTSFTEDKRFLNSEGMDITDKVPNNLVGMIIFTAFLITIASFTKISFVILSSFFFGPALYFIIINCPISVLFNLNTWRQKRTGVDLSSQYTAPRRSPFMSDADLYSPSRSYLQCNSHHRSR